MTVYWQMERVNSDRPSHPSTQWANWKSDKFIAWDREAQVEKEITLPDEFVVIAETYSVKWRLDGKWSCWSNEIYSFSKDIITVRDSDGGLIKEWLWAEIKDYVKWLWLKLHKNVHYVVPGEDVIKTFCIKGAALKSWYETFTDDKRWAAGNNRLKVEKIWNGKTGAIKYSFPVFGIASELTTEDKNTQTALWAKLIAYKNAMTVSADELANDKVAKEAELELPF